MKEERVIKNELKNMLSDVAESIQSIAMESFDGGLKEAETSNGTFNIKSVLQNLAITDYEDPAQVAFKSKALGLFTRSLKFKDFVEKIVDEKYFNSFKTSFILLKDKGFNTELFIPLLKLRAKHLNINYNDLLNKLIPTT